MFRILLAGVLVCAGLFASDSLGTDLRLAPPAGGYAVVVPVVPLVRLATGERLVYTVDGSAPTAAAWPLSQPILLTDTTTLRVATISAQGVVTRQVAGTYTINGLLTTARPVASPVAGAYPAPQRVILTSATSGATIRYTLDGGEPTASSPIYSAALPIATTTTLRARAFGGRLNIRLGRLTLSLPAAFPSGVMTATYVITGQQQQVATPVIAPASGLYRAELTATATTATVDAELRYRLDGTDPGPTDALLPAGGLVVDRSLAVRIRAFRTGWTPSAVVAATYTLQVPEPVITPASGLANAPLTAAITIPTGVTVRFTTDGTDPTASAAVVSGPIAVEHSLQLRAQAERAGWSPSAIVTTAYTLQPFAPTASLPSGSYVGDQSVTLATTTADAAIHYTVDGTVPTTASPQATGPIALPGSCTLQAVVTRTGWTDSPVLSLTYDLRVPDVALTPAGATFTAPVVVQATVPAGAAAVYTVDGSEPTAASASWPVAGVPIDTATTLTVRALRSGWTPSTVAVNVYAFQATAPTVDLPAGPYVGVQAANLVTVTPGATIRYTVDGSDPLTATTAQTATGPIAITRSLTLRAATIRSGWITSPVLEAVYTLNLPPVITSGPTVTPSPVSGTTASVAVVATDDGDPTLLQTAWSATGPATTTFASTGPVSATATFTAVGTYTIQAVVRDQAGQSAMAQVVYQVVADPGNPGPDPSDGPEVPRVDLTIVSGLTGVQEAEIDGESVKLTKQDIIQVHVSVTPANPGDDIVSVTVLGGNSAVTGAANSALAIPVTAEGRFELSATALVRRNGQIKQGESSQTIVLVVDRTPPTVSWQYHTQGGGTDADLGPIPVGSEGVTYLNGNSETVPSGNFRTNAQLRQQFGLAVINKGSLQVLGSASSRSGIDFGSMSVIAVQDGGASANLSITLDNQQRMVVSGFQSLAESVQRNETINADGMVSGDLLETELQGGWSATATIQSRSGVEALVRIGRFWVDSRPPGARIAVLKQSDATAAKFTLPEDNITEFNPAWFVATSNDVLTASEEMTTNAGAEVTSWSDSLTKMMATNGLSVPSAGPSQEFSVWRLSAPVIPNNGPQSVAPSGALQHLTLTDVAGNQSTVAIVAKQKEFEAPIFKPIRFTFADEPDGSKILLQQLSHDQIFTEQPFSDLPVTLSYSTGYGKLSVPVPMGEMKNQLNVAAAQSGWRDWYIPQGIYSGPSFFKSTLVMFDREDRPGDKETRQIVRSAAIDATHAYSAIRSQANDEVYPRIITIAPSWKADSTVVNVLVAGGRKTKPVYDLVTEPLNGRHLGVLEYAPVWQYNGILDEIKKNASYAQLFGIGDQGDSGYAERWIEIVELIDRSGDSSEPIAKFEASRLGTVQGWRKIDESISPSVRVAIGGNWGVLSPWKDTELTAANKGFFALPVSHGAWKPGLYRMGWDISGPDWKEPTSDVDRHVFVSLNLSKEIEISVNSVNPLRTQWVEHSGSFVNSLGFRRLRVIGMTPDVIAAGNRCSVTIQGPFGHQYLGASVVDPESVRFIRADLLSDAERLLKWDALSAFRDAVVSANKQLVADTNEVLVWGESRKIAEASAFDPIDDEFGREQRVRDIVHLNWYARDNLQWQSIKFQIEQEYASRLAIIEDNGKKVIDEAVEAYVAAIGKQMDIAIAELEEERQAALRDVNDESLPSFARASAQRRVVRANVKRDQCNVIRAGTSDGNVTAFKQLFIDAASVMASASPMANYPELDPECIQVIDARVIADTANAGMSQELVCNIVVGPELAAVCHVDVNLGDIRAYPDELSQQYAGANGAHRMKEALKIFKPDVVPTVPKFAECLKKRSGKADEPVIIMNNGGDKSVSDCSLVGTEEGDKNVWSFTAKYDPVIAGETGVTYAVVWDLGGGQVTVGSTGSGQTGGTPTVTVKYHAGQYKPTLKVYRTANSQTTLVGTAAIHTINVYSQSVDGTSWTLTPVAEDDRYGSETKLERKTDEGVGINVRVGVDVKAQGTCRARISPDGYPQNEYWVTAGDSGDLPQPYAFKPESTTKGWTQGYGDPSSAIDDLSVRIKASKSYGDDTTDAKFTTLQLEVGVDANRNHQIEFGEVDSTSRVRPYRFWLNENHDARVRTWVATQYDYQEEDELNDGVADSSDSKISCQRDLQDLFRLWVAGSRRSVVGDRIAQSDTRMKMRVKSIAQSPSIRAFLAADPKGGLTHLTDYDGIGRQQSADGNQSRYNTAMTAVVGSDLVSVDIIGGALSSGWLTDSNSPDGERRVFPMLIEGVSGGIGEIEVRITANLDGKEIVLGRGKSTLDLRSINKFYEQWTLGDTPPGNTPVQFTYQAPTVNPAHQFQYDDADKYFDQDRYMLYVHGWNMEAFDKDWFAATAYKRLWWNGYTGRMGMLRWPTACGADGLIKSLLDAQHYDRSEKIAWQSGDKLAAWLPALSQANHGARIDLIGHSMGNVVVSNALMRLDQSGQAGLVGTYISSQAAVPAQLLAPQGVSDGCRAWEPQLPGLGYFEWNTANVYKTGLLSGLPSGYRMANFNNINDYALSQKVSGINQLLKPDAGQGYYINGLSGIEADADEFRDRFYDILYYTGPPKGQTAHVEAFLWSGTTLSQSVQDAYTQRVLSLDQVVGDPIGRYHIMAYLSESRFYPVGASDDIAMPNGGRVNLRGLWSIPQTKTMGDDESVLGDYSTHRWHSGQFRMTMPEQRLYWTKVIEATGASVENALPTEGGAN